MDLPECPCERCNPQTTDLYRRFTMCPDCGNKRCPKGTDHDLDCTGSNEPGQPGSSWAIIDDVQTGVPLTEDQAAALKEWADLQVAAGHVSMSGFRLPDGKDLLKLLRDETDTEM